MPIFLPSGAGATGATGASGAVLSAEVTLTAADLAVLGTVPFELVPAPGAGKLLVVQNVTLIGKCNGSTDGASLNQEEVRYGNGSGPYVFGIADEAGGFDLSSLMVDAETPRIAFRSCLGVSYQGSGTFAYYEALDAAANLPLVFTGSDNIYVTGAIATTALAAGGTGYVALETVTRGDATVRIDTVGGGGEVLTYTVTVPGTNNIIGAAQATTGGSGADFTVDINTLDYSVNPMTLTVKTLYTVVDV